jgi:hypothetical protein
LERPRPNAAIGVSHGENNEIAPDNCIENTSTGLQEASVNFQHQR